MSLYDFVQQAWNVVEPDKPFVPNWHVDGICRELEWVSRTENANLLINIPPGCLKSLLAGVFWSSWVWTWWPSSRWLFTSYSQELSTRDSLRCRYVIDSPWYQERWGSTVQLVGDQNQKTRFDTTARGWRLATSVGGRGTGEHPHFVVGDDLHNVKQAESEAERTATVEYWGGTMSTRGRSIGSRRVVIGQRLHERDVSGVLIERGTYEHICLPMRFEPGRAKPTANGFEDPRTIDGELLFPQLFPEPLLNEIEAEMASPIKVASQMQQRPVPASGAIFDPALIGVTKAIPAGCSFVRYWDKAGALPGKGDWTVGALMAVTPGASADRLYIVVDIVRTQKRKDERNQLIVQTAATDQQSYGKVAIWIEQPPGLAKESTDTIVRMLAGYTVAADPVRKDKIERAEPLASQIQAGNVKMVVAPWNKPMLDELTVFPFGSHDDQVDALSGAFNKLAKPSSVVLVA